MPFLDFFRQLGVIFRKLSAGKKITLAVLVGVTMLALAVLIFWAGKPQWRMLYTNLDPEDLVDDAFLRRIQIKVEVTSPSEKLFYRLFATMCQQLNVDFDKDSFVHFLREWYHNTGRKYQAVHPRDVLKGVVALCEYEGLPNQLTPELIDEACVNYFVRPQTE